MKWVSLFTFLLHPPNDLIHLFLILREHKTVNSYFVKPLLSVIFIIVSGDDTNANDHNRNTIRKPGIFLVVVIHLLTCIICKKTPHDMILFSNHMFQSGLFLYNLSCFCSVIKIHNIIRLFDRRQKWRKRNILKSEYQREDF